MSIDGFRRARLAGWERALRALPSDQAVCVECGQTVEMVNLTSGVTPCCRQSYLQGLKTVAGLGVGLKAG